MSDPFKVTGNSESKFKKKNHYKLSDGDFVFRIVRPMEKYTYDPKGWSVYHSVHFGYKNTEGKMRAFESPQVKNYKTRMIEVPDPALDRLNDLKSQLEAAKAEGNGPLVARLNTLVGYKGVYNVDNNHHMNVIGLDGSIGELKIRGTAKRALDSEIKRLELEGVYPLSDDDGRFFVFHRDGMSKETNYKVSVYTVKVDLPNGRKGNEEVVHKITPELWNRINEEAFDLQNEISARLTSDEVAQIVAESDLLSGKSPAVDRFFDLRWKAERAQRNSGNVQQVSTPPQSNPAPVQTVSSTPSPVKPVEAPVAPTLTVKVQVPSSTTVQTQAQHIEEMSDEDFFKSINAPQA